ncbi:MAG: hypothetical protein Q8R82_07455 [Hyphomonadaceae bacterium]|nr:hypothetical protein [Hyphomonadaceae bacterium]
MLGLTQEGVMGARRESISWAKDQLSDRARLLALDKLLTRLTTMSDGKGILLGATLDESQAMKAELASLGVDLTTESSYHLTIGTFDSTGKAIAGTKHVATPTEKSAAEAAPLTTAADKNGVEVRTSGTGNARKVYTLYKKEEALTASGANLADLRAATAASLLRGEVQLQKALSLPGALAFESDVFEQQLLKELDTRDKAREASKAEQQRQAVLDNDRQVVRLHKEHDRIEEFKADRLNSEPGKPAPVKATGPVNPSNSNKG